MPYGEMGVVEEPGGRVYSVFVTIKSSQGMSSPNGWAILGCGLREFG